MCQRLCQAGNLNDCIALSFTTRTPLPFSFSIHFSHSLSHCYVVPLCLAKKGLASAGCNHSSRKKEKREHSRATSDLTSHIYSLPKIPPSQSFYIGEVVLLNTAPVTHNALLSYNHLTDHNCINSHSQVFFHVKSVVYVTT